MKWTPLEAATHRLRDTAAALYTYALKNANPLVESIYAPDNHIVFPGHERSVETGLM